MTPPAPVGRTAFVLGLAGLLPQAAAVLVAGWGRWDDRSGLIGVAAVLGTAYALVILTFLGGIWWGFAMRREEGQGPLAAAAVGPSLAAVGLLATILVALGLRPMKWILKADVM